MTKPKALSLKETQRLLRAEDPVYIGPMRGLMHTHPGLLAAKVDYVKRQRQSRDHECHWPSCSKQVPPAMWGCREHWMMLPRFLRQKIWATYRPGQENDRRPSIGYLAAAEQVQEWIRQRYPNITGRI